MSAAQTVALCRICFEVADVTTMVQLMPCLHCFCKTCFNACKKLNRVGFFMCLLLMISVEVMKFFGVGMPTAALLLAGHAQRGLHLESVRQSGLRTSLRRSMRHLQFVVVQAQSLVRFSPAFSRYYYGLYAFNYGSMHELFAYKTFWRSLFRSASFPCNIFVFLERKIKL